MAQKQYWNFKEIDSTNILNKQILGCFLPGLYRGFDEVTVSSSGSTVTFTFRHTATGIRITDQDVTGTDKRSAHTAILLSREGVVITEDSSVAVNVLISSSSRYQIIYVVMRHVRSLTETPNQATYGAFIASTSSSLLSIKRRSYYSPSTWATDTIYNTSAEQHTIPICRILLDIQGTDHLEEPILPIRAFRNSVNTDSLQDDAVTQAKIASNSVGSDQMLANAVTSRELASSAVTNAKIARVSITGSANENSQSNKIADDAIHEHHIADDSVSGDHIQNRSITGNSVVTATDNLIADDAIYSHHISNNAVTNAKIAGNAVDSRVIGAGQVQPVHLDTSSVETAKIADLAVTNAKMQGHFVNGYRGNFLHTLSPNDVQDVEFRFERSSGTLVSNNLSFLFKVYVHYRSGSGSSGTSLRSGFLEFTFISLHGSWNPWVNGDYGYKTGSSGTGTPVNGEIRHDIGNFNRKWVRLNNVCRPHSTFTGDICIQGVINTNNQWARTSVLWKNSSGTTRYTQILTNNI